MPQQAVVRGLHQYEVGAFAGRHGKPLPFPFPPRSNPRISMSFCTTSPHSSQKAQNHAPLHSPVSFKRDLTPSPFPPTPPKATNRKNIYIYIGGPIQLAKSPSRPMGSPRRFHLAATGPQPQLGHPCPARPHSGHPVANHGVPVRRRRRHRP